MIPEKLYKIRVGDGSLMHLYNILHIDTLILNLQCQYAYRNTVLQYINVS